MIERKDITIIAFIENNITSAIENLNTLTKDLKVIFVCSAESKDKESTREFNNKIYYYSFDDIKEMEILKDIIQEVDTEYIFKINEKFETVNRIDFSILEKDKVNILADFISPLDSGELFNIPVNRMVVKTSIFKKWIKSKVDHTFSKEQNYWLSWIKYKYNVSALIQNKNDINYVDFLFWKDILLADILFIDETKNSLQIDIISFLNTSSRKQFMKLLANKFFRKYK